MDRVPFFKMSGSGNDFIIVDNRQAQIEKTALPPFIAAICRRGLSVGSDGFILVEDTEGADFKWHFYNSDGSRAEMCGNGARCVSRFAYVTGIAGREMTFETDAGIVTATVTGDKVKIGVPDPSGLQMDETIETSNGDITLCRVNTGVPHAVIEVSALDQIDVVNLGKEIRNHTHFAPAGTNVNFISILGEGRIALRTYELGSGRRNARLRHRGGGNRTGGSREIWRGFACNGHTGERLRSDCLLRAGGRCYFQCISRGRCPYHLSGRALGGSVAGCWITVAGPDHQPAGPFPTST